MKSKMKNTVIHIWTNNCSNIKYDSKDSTSYWGIGDLIRGTIKLFQLQKYNLFNILHIIQNTNDGNFSTILIEHSR